MISKLQKNNQNNHRTYINVIDFNFNHTIFKFNFKNVKNSINIRFPTFGSLIDSIYLPFKLYTLENSKQMKTNCLDGQSMGVEIITDE